MNIDFEKHPYLVQFRPRPMFGIIDEGVSSLTIDLINAEIVVRRIRKKTQKANERIYDINEELMASLLEFFTIEAIDEFDSLSEEELERIWDGSYRDEGYRIDYYILCENHVPARIVGSLGDIYDSNPLEKALKWVRNTALPDVLDVRI